MKGKVSMVDDPQLSNFISSINKLDNLRNAVMSEIVDHPDFRVESFSLEDEVTYIVLQRVDSFGVKHGLDLEVDLRGCPDNCVVSPDRGRRLP